MRRDRINWRGFIGNVFSGAGAGAGAAVIAAGYHWQPVLIGAAIGVLVGVGGFLTPRHRHGDDHGR